jgi:cytochrome P450
LAKNPDKQQKLFEEIQRYLPDKDQPVTSDILNEMKYLKACIKESMRYYKKMDFSIGFVETTSSSMIKDEPSLIYIKH